MSDSFKDLVVLTKLDRSRGNENKIGLFILVTLGISVFNLILLLVQAMGINGIAHRPMPTMVQLVNGKTIEVKAYEGKDRSPQLIKDFNIRVWGFLYKPSKRGNKHIYILGLPI